jgi:NAD(P)-dependent dehydrogenase (short-subunit alcohol dehydrogenase family)
MDRTVKKALIAAGALAGIWAAGRLIRQLSYSFRDKVVVISGGSRGLGLVLARQLAAEGAKLALLARDHDELNRAVAQLGQFNTDVVALVCDVRLREEVDSAIAEIVEYFGRIDVLINNAGVIQVGPIEHMTEEDFEDSLDIHFWAPLYTSMAAIPYMKRQGGGKIVNIASFGGKVAVPHLVPYCAGKFALVGLTEGLCAELRKDHIGVTLVCPWLMRTGSPPNAFFKGQNRKEYAWFSIGGAPPGMSLNVDRAARKILGAVRRGQARLIMGAQAKLLVLGSELMPETAARARAMVNLMLPGPTGPEGDELHTGWESFSDAAPSAVTRFSDQATIDNNEMPPKTAAEELRL